MKKIKPDYSCDSSASGHTKSCDEKASEVYGTNCSWEWPRWFDDKRRKRRVGVVIDKFYGDYHHFYAVLEEEKNPYWLPPCDEYPRGVWVEDERARGQKFYEKFNTKAGAEAYADIVIRDHFPDHRAVVQKEEYGKPSKKTWHYSREGD